MRKIALALAAVAAVGLTVPMVTSSADARTKVVIVKKKHHWDRGRHYGWDRGHHYGWRNHHHRGATVVVR